MQPVEAHPGGLAADGCDNGRKKMAGDIVIGDKALDQGQRPPGPAEGMFIIPIAAQRGRLGRHRSAWVTLAMASI